MDLLALFGDVLDMDERYLSELADTYYRGLMEVDQWIQDYLEKEYAD